MYLVHPPCRVGAGRSRRRPRSPVEELSIIRANHRARWATPVWVVPGSTAKRQVGRPVRSPPTPPPTCVPVVESRSDGVDDDEGGHRAGQRRGRRDVVPQEGQITREDDRTRNQDLRAINASRVR